MTQPGTSRRIVIQAAAWMMLTVVSFVVMAVAIRSLAPTISAVEMVAFRSIVGLVIISAIILATGRGHFKTTRPALHLGRNLVHFSAMLCWTIGVASLPLAQAISLEFTQPIWLALLAALFLGEKLHLHRIIAIVCGFIGVLMIVQPGRIDINPSVFVVLYAAFGYAVSMIFVKMLVRTESPLTLLFYMNLMQLPMALVPASFNWVTPTLSQMPWVILLGVAGLGAHYGMARALKIADASLVYPIEFLRLPVLSAVGWLLYGEQVGWMVFAGGVLMFAGNYYSLWQDQRKN